MIRASVNAAQKLPDRIEAGGSGAQVNKDVLHLRVVLKDDLVGLTAYPRKTGKPAFRPALVCAHVSEGPQDLNAIREAVQ